MHPLKLLKPTLRTPQTASRRRIDQAQFGPDVCLLLDPRKIAPTATLDTQPFSSTDFDATSYHDRRWFAVHSAALSPPKNRSTNALGTASNMLLTWLESIGSQDGGGVCPPLPRA